MVSSVEIGRGSLVVEGSVEDVKLEGELAGTVELESVEAVADVDESLRMVGRSVLSWKADSDFVHRQWLSRQSHIFCPKKKLTS